MANIVLTDALITDAAFWGGINLSGYSTLNASAVSDVYQITVSATGITFVNTTTGVTVASYTNADLASGAFSEINVFVGNGADNVVGGGTGTGQVDYTGGSGDDVLTDDGTAGGQLIGGAGNDTLQGGSGNNYNINGGAGDDILRSGGGSNQLRGGAGNDTLIGESGNGNLRGDSGDDVIIREGGAYNIVGGAGNDTVIINGGSGNIAVNAGDDTVILNVAVTDFIDGGTGTNTLILPAGASFAPYSPGNAGGVITFADGSQTNYSGFDVEDISIACFASGTLVDTPAGPVAIEDLAIGEAVNTLDDGPQPIRWIGQRTVPADGAFAPVCIAKGALGNGTDLYVSPQHRMLVSGPLCHLLFDAPQVLCAAKYLCDGDRIYRAPRRSITYFHLMFDKHQVVRANGVLSESFFIGDYQARADCGTYGEILALFPELGATDHPARQPIRPFLKAYEARALKCA